MRHAIWPFLISGNLKFLITISIGLIFLSNLLLLSFQRDWFCFYLCSIWCWLHVYLKFWLILDVVWKEHAVLNYHFTEQTSKLKKVSINNLHLHQQSVVENPSRRLDSKTQPHTIPISPEICSGPDSSASLKSSSSSGRNRFEALIENASGWIDMSPILLLQLSPFII